MTAGVISAAEAANQAMIAVASNVIGALCRAAAGNGRREQMADFTNNTRGLAVNETFEVFGSTRTLAGT
jgi:hypothetical protein